MGRGPSSPPPGERACPVTRDPGQGAAAQVVHHGASHAVLDQRDRLLRRALGVEGARQRGAELRRVREVDRRGGDLLPEPTDQRAAPLGVGQPVQSGVAQQLEQRADRGRLHHDRVRRPTGARRRSRGRAPSRRRARRAGRGPASTPPRPRWRRSPSARPARCRSPSSGRRWCGRVLRRQRLSRPRARPPPPTRPRAPRARAAAPWRRWSRARRRRWQRRAPRSRRRARGDRERAGRAQSRGVRGSGAVAAAASAASRARRAQSRSDSGPVSLVAASPTCPSITIASSTVTSSIAVAWVGRLAAKRSSSERSWVTWARASRVGAAATAASATSRAFKRPHLHVAEARRRRTVRDVRRLAGLALAAVEQRVQLPLRLRADRVAARPERGRHAGVARIAHAAARARRS